MKSAKVWTGGLRAAAVLLAGLMLAASSWANGKFTLTEGDVSLSDGRGGAARKMAVDMPVTSGSEIVTGNNSRAAMRMDDGQVFALSSNSRFKIDEYRYDPARPEQGSTISSLLAGSLRVVSGLIASKQPRNFAIKTATATIGVRGTDFIVGIAADGNVYFTVLEGTVQVGGASFAAGTTGLINAATGAITSTAAASIPAATTFQFSQLTAMQASVVASAVSSTVAAATAGGAAAGVAAGTAALAAAGITIPAIVGGLAALAAAVAASRSTTTHGQ
jgi:hypothetical protein